MKKTIFAFCLVTGGLSAQVSTPSNAGLATDYLGWNNTNTFPLQIRHNANQPINFFTNTTQRMTILGGTATDVTRGFVGIGVTNPTNLLHLNSTFTGDLFLSNGPADSLNQWRLLTAGTHRFRIYTPKSSSNLFLQTRSSNAIMGFQTGGLNVNYTRMLIRGDNDSLFNSGHIAIGNNLPASFFARDRVHLYHSYASTVAMRYSHAGTGPTNNDGTLTGILTNGDFRLMQFENSNTDIWTPGAVTPAPVQRFRILPNRQVFVGNGSATQDVTAGSPVPGFSVDPTSLLNLSGPINSCALMTSPGVSQPTMLYGYTSPNDNVPPAGDGYRLHMNINIDGTNHEALVFEKTDANNPNPDGFIAFTNTGDDAVEELSLFIDGAGRTSFGKQFLLPLTNRVTINSQAGDVSPSGLRFIDLPSTSTPVTNPGTGVLAVDANGNVIYTTLTSTPGSGVGNYCSAPSNPLSGDYEIPLNGFNYSFTGNGGSRSSVLVGYDCGWPPLPAIPVAKMDVLQTGSNGGFSPSGRYAIAGQFYANNPTPIISMGVNGISAIDPTHVATSIGGNFEATGGGDNYGVLATASGGATNWAGYFNGAVFALSYTTSDQNLKENIADYSNAGNLLAQLHPVSYNFKTLEYPQLNLEDTPQIGLISQELELVLPAAVKEATSPPVIDRETGEITYPSVTFKTVAYEKLIPILVGGHQEQQSEIDSLTVVNEELQEINEQQDALINDLTVRLAQLENCLQAMFPGMCETNQGMIQQNSPETQEQLKAAIKVNLSDKNTIVLNQNVPNPFAESTAITYSIPVTVKKAQIHFYNASGKLLQSVDITERGAGRLQVFGNDLSSGTYTYALIADGQVAATKKLVKE